MKSLKNYWSSSWITCVLYYNTSVPYSPGISGYNDYSNKGSGISADSNKGYYDLPNISDLAPLNINWPGTIWSSIIVSSSN